MLSIEQCKKILKNDLKNYTDEEVRQIRDLLYKVGHLDYLLYQQKQAEDAERHHLHQGINRRAS